MNRYSLIMLISLIIGFSPQAITQHLPGPFDTSMGIQSTFNESATQATDSLIQSLIDQTNLDTLIHFVKILSGEDSVTIGDSTYLLLSRNVFHAHNNLTADFLFQTLSRFGLPTYNQNYSAVGRNVYAVQTGAVYPDQKFIICAHYDDMPMMQPPAPGADDNASSAAVVLEAARLISPIQTPYTIIFALWDEEEIGLIGSANYARLAVQSGEQILGIINMDMLGWDPENDGLMNIETSSIANSVALANLIKSLNANYQIGLSPVIYNPGSLRSDHKSFWDQGFSAVEISEWSPGQGSIYPFLHTSNDRIEHFNLPYFHALSKLSIATIAHLAFYNMTPVGVETKEAAFVADFVLEQNYPNPFNERTVICYQLPARSPQSAIGNQVDLSVYNMLGQKVATLVSEQQSAGIHQLNWDASGLASGVYLYRLGAEGFVQTKKLILLR